MRIKGGDPPNQMEGTGDYAAARGRHVQTPQKKRHAIESRVLAVRSTVPYVVTQETETDRGGEGGELVY